MTIRSSAVLNVTTRDICISDHLPILGVRLNNHKLKDTKRQIHCLSRLQTPWLSQLHNDTWNYPLWLTFVFEDTENGVETWYKLLNDAINTNAPLKKNRIKHDKQPEWLTPEILDLM